jgi:hypothetical protein
VYLPTTKSRHENWDLDGSIWWRWEVKMSGSPSSKRKVVQGGLGGGGVVRGGGVSA